MAFTDDDLIQPTPDWRESMSPNVPAPAPIAAPITASVPIREVGGNIVPAPDTSGLYAIYGRKNPHTAKAAIYGEAARQPGGTGINFAAPIAAFMAGRETAKSVEFEKQKDADIASFMKRKEAYDKIKNDRDTRQANAKYLAETVFPAAQQEYATVLKDTKDDKAASSAAAKVANQMAADQGIPTPEVVAFNAWKGATTFAVRNDKGEISTAIYKDGAMQVQDQKGDFKTPTEKWMSVKDLSDLMDAQARSQRGMTSGLKGKEHIYLTANGELLHSTDPEAAKKQGAVKVMVDTNDEDGVKVTKEYFLPGMGPKGAQPALAAAPASEKPGVMGRVANVLTNELVKPQPGAAAPAAQPAQPTRSWMINPSGKKVMIEGSVDDALKAGYKLVQ